MFVPLKRLVDEQVARWSGQKYTWAIYYYSSNEGNELLQKSRSIQRYSQKRVFFFLVKHTCPSLRHEGVWGSRFITPLILNLDAS